ncbi:unnamed protein product [Cylicostephanus goldi]|uniref:protein-tyrosine-phosphatase n=1 Tax=Cylicostephanus goldi TaxID=71465 RepID=A0A3P6T4H4_CYLGO|nr:unnamed protein product [Cylicostephanus goldi]
MVWQEKSVLIVSMIQMFDVNGAEVSVRKSNRKNRIAFQWGICYIPQKTGEELNTEAIKLVHCGTRCVRRTYDATILKVIRDGVERKLLHICFFSWGHKGTPRRPTELLNFLADINFNRDLLLKEAITAGWLKANETSPLVVHCLSGAGRGATLIALDICMKKMDDTAGKSCGVLVDVEDVVLRIRTQRAMAMQIPEQFLFLHLAVFEYAVRQRYITDEIYAEIGVENYFYEPRETKTEEPEQSSRTGKTPRKRSKRMGPSR